MKIDEGGEMRTKTVDELTQVVSASSAVLFEREFLCVRDESACEECALPVCVESDDGREGRKRGKPD